MTKAELKKALDYCKNYHNLSMPPGDEVHVWNLVKAFCHVYCDVLGENRGVNPLDHDQASPAVAKRIKKRIDQSGGTAG